MRVTMLICVAMMLALFGMASCAEYGGGRSIVVPGGETPGATDTPTDPDGGPTEPPVCEPEPPVCNPDACFDECQEMRCQCESQCEVCEYNTRGYCSDSKCERRRNDCLEACECAWDWCNCQCEQEENQCSSQ